jgi:hypothetical protein
MKDMKRYTFQKKMAGDVLTSYSIYASAREVQAQFDLEILTWGTELLSLKVFPGSRCVGTPIITFKQENT